MLEVPLPAALRDRVVSPASGEVVIRSYEPERVLLEVQSDGPGVVVLTDAHYPGWEVLVNGARRELLRVNYLFRGVEVGAGSQLVEFRFRPSSFWTGAVVSAVSLSLVALLLFVSRAQFRARLDPGAVNSEDR